MTPEQDVQTIGDMIDNDHRRYASNQGHGHSKLGSSESVHT